MSEYDSVQCFCGGTAYLDSYKDCGEIWYFYECDRCGRSNRLHFNTIENAYDAFISGDVILYDNQRYFWNIRN